MKLLFTQLGQELVIPWRGKDGDINTGPEIHLVIYFIMTNIDPGPLLPS